jgi:hypothetical protein
MLNRNEILFACHPERASSTSESKGPHKSSSAVLYEVSALFPVGILRLRDPSGRSAQDDYWGFLQEAELLVPRHEDIAHRKWDTDFTDGHGFGP